MSLADDNDKEDTEIKALTDSGTDLIEIDDSEADEKDALDSFFLSTIYVKVYKTSREFNIKI